MKCILEGKEEWRIPMNMVSQPNMLINWDFRNPVNRNGKTEYITMSNRCTIDGWKSRDSNGIVTLTDDGLKLSGIRALIYQVYQRPAIGTALTYSALVKGPVTAGFLGSANSISAANNEGSFELLTVTITVTENFNDTTIGLPMFLNNSGANVSGKPTEEDCWIKAVKLELGTKQTLARQNESGEWELIDPPDYALQYALCSQYSPITGEFVGSQHSNENLLDNARWDKNAYIINQMGYTKWTSDPKPETGADANTKYSYNAGKYSIDRWILQRVHTAELVANGFKLTCQPANANLMLLEQKIENLDLSSPYTISVLISDIDGPANVWRVRGCAGPNYTIPTAPGLYSYTVTNPAGGDIYFWRIPTEEECSITISAVKIERGYVQTLAHKEGDTWVLNDPPPNKALELAKCQRYQLLLIDSPSNFGGPIGYGLVENATDARICIPTPVTMRSNPSLVRLTEGQGPLTIYDSGGAHNVTVDPVAAQGNYNNQVFFIMKSTNLAIGPCAVRITQPGGQLLLDANL